MSLLDRLEPGARACMKRIIREGGKPLSQLGVEAARQYMRESQSTPLGNESVVIERADAASVRLMIVRPAICALRIVGDALREGQHG